MLVILLRSVPYLSLIGAESVVECMGGDGGVGCDSDSAPVPLVARVLKGLWW